MSSLASRAWLVVALLWPVAMLNYLDRQMLSTLKTSVMADIPSIGTNENFGLIMAVFMYVYAVLSPIGGFIGDRFNRRITLILSLLVWSAVTFATGLASTFNEMLVLRGLMGISEAFYIPTALALIAEFHPGPTRTRAVGIHQTGIYVGLALGGVGGFIAAQTGSWRNSFYLFGLIGIAYSAVLYFSLPGSPESGRPRAESKSASIATTVRTLGGQLAFWLLVAYFTLPAIAGWVMKNWLPTHLQDAFALSESSAGMWANATPVLGNVCGAIFGGWLADAWSIRTPRGRILASAAGTMLVAAGLIVLGYSGTSLPTAVAGMLLFGVGWGMFDANNMPILCQLVKPEFRATGYGFMNLVSITAGAQATVLLGAMKDQGTPFSQAFVISAAIAVVGALLILLVKPKSTDAGTPPALH